MSTQSPAPAPDSVDLVRDAVLAVPDVVDLNGGMFGEVATHLSGRKVLGIRFTADGTEVHIKAAFGADVRRTAGAVRLAVGYLVEGPVHVFVDDVVPQPSTPPPLSAL